MTIDILRAREGEKTFLETAFHPLTKMVIVGLVLFISGLWLDIRYLAPLLIVGLILAFMAKVPKSWFVVLITALILSWYPILRTTAAQANPEYFQVLDRTWAATPIFTITVPFLKLGELGLTYGTLYWLIGRLIRYATVVTWALVFVVTTSMSEISNTLYALKVPYQIVFVLQITYKFIPFMSSVITQISDAQKLRGWNLRTFNIVKIIKRSLPIANPLIRRTAFIVDQVTIATQIRGFGSTSITPLRDLTLSVVDKILIVVFSVGFVLALLALIFFKAGMI
jgi:energy-coupling factor transporter transmembrane protein EcfT